MQQPRRVFLAAAATMAAATALGAAQRETPNAMAAAAQQDPNAPNPNAGPPPIPNVNTLPRPFSSRDDDDIPLPKIDPAAIMKANQQTVKKDLARMADLIRQMQKDIESNDSKDVLSLGVLKASEEVEKLAKQVREMIVS